MPPGEIERALGALEQAVYQVASAGAVPLILGGDHSIALPDATGVARHLGYGKVSMIHFDAHADTGDIEFGSLYGHGQPMRRLIESGALRGDRFLQMGLRGYWPGPETLSWMAEQNMRSYEMTEIGKRGLDACLDEAFEIALDECDAVFLSVDIDVCDPGPRARHRHARARRALRRASCSTPYAGSAASCPSPASTWSRCRRRTTTRRSPRSSPTGCASRRCPGWLRARSGSRTTPPDRCWRDGDRPRLPVRSTATATSARPRSRSRTAGSRPSARRAVPPTCRSSRRGSPTPTCTRSRAGSSGCAAT